jgi:hypothetical protein
MSTNSGYNNNLDTIQVFDRTGTYSYFKIIVKMIKSRLVHRNKRFINTIVNIY